MSELTNTFLLVYAGLFPIVNPIGGAPLFLGLTSLRTPAERHLLARRVAINSALLLIGSMFVGSHLLVFFGITLPVVRIAGGLVLVAFGWKLLHSGLDIDGGEAASRSRGPAESESFYPLTLPLTVGPGSISVAIALGSQRPSEHAPAEVALLAAAALAGILAISLTVYVCYRFAETLIARLGDSGINIVVRLSAFILLCIGIQILWTGYSTLPPVPR
ncbi:MarC family protein [Siccirubricoccus phaeus]|uniref:MarC family protein n=1 Tax=Siccirubricoccus phaeus TaxID=2595053 RepID=UPI001A9C61F2|nr:MarC family protein [Siccirubricoccus phaeus]